VEKIVQTNRQLDRFDLEDFSCFRFVRINYELQILRLN